MLHILQQPWPWYVAGALIGLIVPALLLLGNKHFGISANLRHACAACFPAGIKFFQYDWKKEIWNFFFVGGIFLGAMIASQLLKNPHPVAVNPALVKELAGYGITDHNSLLPKELFSWENLFTIRGLILLVGGGFLVGFGTRYAGGCTSGHAIMGLSNLQWPSLVATAMFMAGGFIMANLVLPFILQLHN
ncbi:MAG TPA: YeeE/YedE thiosulfate transporter family protein [Chitinophaga sp.]|uniref:YeeE/YedE family protein n=1 Tax=Chitinophaga sp. TaxID=1869181 RepID=UPI002DBBB519|nr:YeeE/YedE thiosulfate transporter family protein [Chitinophaga sp.]HEU4556135.1 YeeE/YedE thiosulfate transporter family protein [Chitinophaga sp.]